MASDRKTIAAEDHGLGSIVGDWLDPFAQEASAAASRTAADDEDRLPFSEWCVLPIAALIVIGDMILQFMH